MFIGPRIIVIVEELKTNQMSLAVFYFTSYRLNMFRALICPSSGVCDQLLNYQHTQH